MDGLLPAHWSLLLDSMATVLHQLGFLSLSETTSEGVGPAQGAYHPSLLRQGLQFVEDRHKPIGSLLASTVWQIRLNCS